MNTQPIYQKKVGLTLLIFAGSALLFALLGCRGISKVDGNKEIVTRNYDLDSIKKLDISIPAELNFAYGDKERVSITMDENLFEYIEMTTKKSLQIKVKTPHSLLPSQSIKIDVLLNKKIFSEVAVKGSASVNGVEFISKKIKISIAGSGDLKVTKLATPDLSVDINGSGDVLLKTAVIETGTVSISGSGDFLVREIQAPELSVDINGSGNFETKIGTIETATITVNGSGDFLVPAEIAHANISIEGSGKGFVNVSQSLTAAIQGGGDIEYTGSPETLITNIQGSGTVRKR